jgi:hypothetical protein
MATREIRRHVRSDANGIFAPAGSSLVASTVFQADWRIAELFAFK